MSGFRSNRRLVLIETLWNVKVKLTDFHAIDRFGINRNIVECKELTFQRRCSRLRTSINRNIVECKVNISASVIEYREVLIETLWNVK
mgnify:CR=1 FL=1